MQTNTQKTIEHLVLGLSCLINEDKIKEELGIVYLEWKNISGSALFMV